MSAFARKMGLPFFIEGRELVTFDGQRRPATALEVALYRSLALVAEPPADAPGSSPGAPSGREGSTPSESTD